MNMIVHKYSMLRPDLNTIVDFIQKTITVCIQNMAKNICIRASMGHVFILYTTPLRDKLLWIGTALYLLFPKRSPPKILSLSFAMGADYSLLAFFKHNNSFVATVYSVHI